MSNFTVVYDANVLYPNFLRDLLMRLALVGLFRARWSKDIHREWMEAVLADRPELEREKLERTRELMDRNVLDALVTGYEDLIPGLQLPDPNDRHVLAVAIRAQAQLIITRNHKDFPERALEPYGVKTEGPDNFMVDLLHLNEQRALKGVLAHRNSLRNPPFTPEDYYQGLLRQGLHLTAGYLKTAWTLSDQS